MSVKRTTFQRVSSALREYWQILAVLVAISGGAFIFASLPGRVDAVEKKQSQIEQYIQAIEEQKKLMKEAPPGWLWSIKEERYVPDPNYEPSPKKRRRTS